MKNLILLTTLLLSSLSTISGQNSQPAEPENLSEQFKILLKNAETYSEYKVIKETRLNEFWRLLEDSVQQFKTDIATAQKIHSDQQTEIEFLQKSIKEKDDLLATTDFAMTHIRFLGVDFSKTSFIIINVILIGGLIALLALGSFQYNINRITARQKVLDYQQIEEEFNTLRSQSLEKQIKLKRELQTERNLIEDMRSRPTISKKMPA